MDCSDKADGSTVPDPDDCTKFSVCVGGVIVMSLDCPPGFWFHDTLQGCDSQMNVEPTCTSTTSGPLVPTDKTALCFYPTFILEVVIWTIIILLVL